MFLKAYTGLSAPKLMEQLNANIHPTESKLLWECIEKVYPMMCETSREFGIHRMRTKYLDVYAIEERHDKGMTIPIH